MKLDVQQAFYQIRLDKEAEDLMTFYTRYRLYKYKILSFKLCNELASFQRFINNVLIKYLDDFYTIYIDNILIYSDNPLEYELYIKKVLNCL